MIAQWAGCSEGVVVKATCHVISAVLSLHDQVIRWPSMDKKQEVSDWVESASCSAWRAGYCMVDGTLIPLFRKPGHYGEQFYDWKSNYLLSLTVCFFLPFCTVFPLIPLQLITLPNLQICHNPHRHQSFPICSHTTSAA